MNAVAEPPEANRLVAALRTQFGAELAIHAILAPNYGVTVVEAFAAQCLAVIRSLELDRSKVNVNGGVIALGHPVGATGVRIVVTLLHEMKRRGVVLGFAGLCVGGGQGGTLIFEQK